jgi:hypothetical protein
MTDDAYCAAVRRPCWPLAEANMDLITPALLTAIAAAAKEKAVGVAVDLVADAAKDAANKLRGLLPDGTRQHLCCLLSS